MNIFCLFKKNIGWKNLGCEWKFRALTFVLLFVFSFSLSSCAYTNSYKNNESDYDAEVSPQVHEKRLFVRGEQRLSMKVMVGSAKLHQLQGGVAPGFEFPYLEGKDQVIVAVSSQNRIPFARDELKFALDGVGAERVVELTSSFQIQTLYPYAYPYYRVFVVDFVGNNSDSRDFELRSSRGALGVKLQFRPPSQNLVN